MASGHGRRRETQPWVACMEDWCVTQAPAAWSGRSVDMIIYKGNCRNRKALDAHDAGAGAPACFAGRSRPWTPLLAHQALGDDEGPPLQGEGRTGRPTRRTRSRTASRCCPRLRERLGAAWKPENMKQALELYEEAGDGYLATGFNSGYNEVIVNRQQGVQRRAAAGRPGLLRARQPRVRRGAPRVACWHQKFVRKYGDIGVELLAFDPGNWNEPFRVYRPSGPELRQGGCEVLDLHLPGLRHRRRAAAGWYGRKKPSTDFVQPGGWAAYFSDIAFLSSSFWMADLPLSTSRNSGLIHCPPSVFAWRPRRPVARAGHEDAVDDARRAPSRGWCRSGRGKSSFSASRGRPISRR